MRMKLGKFAGAFRLGAALAAISIFAVSAGAAGGQKNPKVKVASQADPNAPPMPAGSDADQIENAIGQMLAGFQLGKVDLMHKYYADNVTFVSGAYEPPIAGWQNYVPVYQREFAAFQGIQLIRRNTIIFPHGDVAWAMYQWEFDAMLNDRPYSARGQTTLVLNKVNGNWLIVHNHTSEISASDASATAQQPAAQQTPATAKP